MGKLSDNWNKEVQRDILALGSPVFYFLTIGRALVGPFWDLFNPLIILAVALFVISRAYPLIDLYIARGLVLAVMITRHYNDILFGLFALVAIVLMVASALNIGKSKPAVKRGIWLGIALSAVGYPLAAASENPT